MVSFDWMNFRFYTAKTKEIHHNTKPSLIAEYSGADHEARSGGHQLRSEATLAGSQLLFERQLARSWASHVTLSSSSLDFASCPEVIASASGKWPADNIVIETRPGIASRLDETSGCCILSQGEKSCNSRNYSAKFHGWIESTSVNCHKSYSELRVLCKRPPSAAVLMPSGLYIVLRLADDVNNDDILADM